MRPVQLLALALVFGMSLPSFAAKKSDSAAEEAKPILSAEAIAGLKLRAIGPAMTSGRVSDLAIDAERPTRFFVAVASGGVWRTENAGTTFEPVFDGEGSYSIGCVTIDPNDPLTVWVGTGENNSQRSVGYGDGVYRSRDGGSSWENVGLKESEHIAKIWVDPRDSQRVLVAAQGPLWRSGGDRGLFETKDGGATWKKLLGGGEHTGVTDLVVDPADPDPLWAATYQRRRHVWTLIDGGPESAVHKSTDGGATWTKLEKGLPKGDLGRIGLALGAGDARVVYAVVEAAAKDGNGFYRSLDGGASWAKRSGTSPSSPQYYQELIADPIDPDRVYMIDTLLKVTEDGGATFTTLPWHEKHVDEHALWIDPRDTKHLLTGNDGGLYESWDRGTTWRHFENLPITQFYKLGVGPGAPFYLVCGGTQDNNTQCGPARTDSSHGVLTADWFVALTGDGFEPAIDPVDPDIIYAQSQNGGLGRFDRRTGEVMGIAPQPADGEALRWNWDAALLLSPHHHQRLYYAANRLYRSDDRGNSWSAVSGDLTRQLDRNTLKVMDRVWSVDAVAKNASTSFYGNVVALTESPLVEGLLYVGTDDGLVQVSEDGGASWRVIESISGVPERSYVHDLRASPHDADTVFAAFDNHKMGDFLPYVYESRDRGRSWKAITGDLPKRGQANTVAQDHVDPNLIFVGTEFGAFASPDRGKHWLKLALPTIPVMDLVLQSDADDLVLATFGRGFYVLDDLAPLRGLSEPVLTAKATLFPVEPAHQYIERSQLGFPGPGFRGHTLYMGTNPPNGARLLYHLAEGLESRAEARRSAEGKAATAGSDTPYPPWDALRAEDREIAPAMVVTVTDATGRVVRRLPGNAAKGIQTVVWDLRESSPEPASLVAPEPNFFGTPTVGPLVVPGRYTATLAERIDGVTSAPLGSQTFDVVALANADVAEARATFQRRTADLRRLLAGAAETLDDAKNRAELALVAANEVQGDNAAIVAAALQVRTALADLSVRLDGDSTVARRNEPTPPGLADRVALAIGDHWPSSTAAAPQTLIDSVALAEAAYPTFAADLKATLERLTALEQQLDAAKAPWTPGRAFAR